MTFQSLVDTISGNLGDRASGEIGGQPAGTVIIRAANLGIAQCVKSSNPTAYDTTVTLSIPSGGAQEYAFPTVDGQRIKDITGYRFTRDSDDTRVSVTKITYPQFIQVTGSFKQALTGTPSYWSLYKETIYINRVPAEDYTLTLYVELFPKELTTDNLNEALPINAEWEIAAEAYATYYCFLKLQQINDSVYWKGLYEEQRTENTRMIRKKNIRGQGMGNMQGGSRVLDPFNNDTGYRY